MPEKIIKITAENISANPENTIFAWICPECDHTGMTDPAEISDDTEGIIIECICKTILYVALRRCEATDLIVAIPIIGKINSEGIIEADDL